MINYPIATQFLKVKTNVQITRPVRKLCPLDFFEMKPKIGDIYSDW